MLCWRFVAVHSSHCIPKWKTCKEKMIEDTPTPSCFSSFSMFLRKLNYEAWCGSFCTHQAFSSVQAFHSGWSKEEPNGAWQWNFQKAVQEAATVVKCLENVGKWCVENRQKALKVLTHSPYFALSLELVSAPVRSEDSAAWHVNLSVCVVCVCVCVCVCTVWSSRSRRFWSVFLCFWSYVSDGYLILAFVWARNETWRVEGWDCKSCPYVRVWLRRVKEESPAEEWNNMVPLSAWLRLRFML